MRKDGAAEAGESSSIVYLGDGLADGDNVHFVTHFVFFRGFCAI